MVISALLWLLSNFGLARISPTRRGVATACCRARRSGAFFAGELGADDRTGPSADGCRGESALG